MNILIVDDETIIREWLQHTVQSLEGLNVHADTASDGIEALEMLQKISYDVIFIDIQMPRMNGIDLIREIHRINQKVLPIILSSHDEFDYAREVMRNGAFEYILKSECDKTSLKELLLRCRNQLQDSHSNIEASIHTFLVKVLQKQDIEEKQILSLFPGWKEKSYFVISFTLNHLENFSASLRQSILASDFRNVISDNILFLGEVENVFYYLFEWRPIQLKSSKSGKGWHIILPSFLAEICRKHPQMKAGCSKVSHQLSELILCIREACRNLEQLYYENASYRTGISLHEIIPIEEFQHLNAELIQDIRTYDNQKFFHDLRNQEEWILKYEPEVPFIKEAYSSLLYSLCLYYCEDTAILSDLFVQMKRKIEHTTSFSELQEYAWSMIRHYILSLPAAKTYSSHVEAALTYIAENYADISSIKEIADHIHLNTDYLTRLFKKETGRNLNTFLMDYKLEIASYMLKTTNLQISEIALNVGIPNISYFSKKFKERYEMQPVNYRSLYR